MSHSRKTALIAAASLLAAGSANAQDGDAKAGERIFKRCMACHMVGDDAKNRIGPVLNDLFGRQAGTVEGFKYSPVMVALGEAGLKWAPDTFAGYVGNPRKWLTVKAKELGLDCSKLKNCRNRMQFAGLRKKEDIENVIAYLVTHDSDGLPQADEKAGATK
jgi:cytochrome c2